MVTASKLREAQVPSAMDTVLDSKTATSAAVHLQIAPEFHGAIALKNSCNERCMLVAGAFAGATKSWVKAPPTH